METKIINLTGHLINVIMDGRPAIPIAPSETHWRLNLRAYYDIYDDINGIPIFRVEYEAPEGRVPEREEGKIFVVSSLVAQHFPDRDDFYMVGQTVKAIGGGKVIGCRGLVKNPFFKS